MFTLLRRLCTIGLVQRYLTIARPRAPRLSPTLSTASLASIWGVSVVVATPTLLYSTTMEYEAGRGRHRTACLMVWPDGDPRSDIQNLFLP